MTPARSMTSLCFELRGDFMGCLKQQVLCWGICNAMVIRNCSIYPWSNCIRGVWCVVLIESWNHSKAPNAAQVWTSIVLWVKFLAKILYCQEWQMGS